MVPLRYAPDSEITYAVRYLRRTSGHSGKKRLHQNSSLTTPDGLCMTREETGVPSVAYGSISEIVTEVASRFSRKVVA